MKKSIIIIVLFIFISNCNPKKTYKFKLAYPKANFKIINNLKHSNNFLQICFDGKTKTHYNRFEAIWLTLNKLLKLKNKIIVIKYFLSPDSSSDRNRLSKIFSRSKKNNFILTQMAHYKKNVYDCGIKKIFEYGKINWFIYKDLGLTSKQILNYNKIIMPNYSLLKYADFTGHVNGYIKKSKYHGIPLFIKWKKFLIPSLSLALALRLKNINIKNLNIIKNKKGYLIKFKKYAIKTDKYFNTKTYFPKNKTYKTISMIDIINGNVNLKNTKNIIFISEKIKAPIFKITNYYKVDSNELTICHTSSILKQLNRE